MDVLLDFEAVGIGLVCVNCRTKGLSLYRCLTCLGKFDYCQQCIVFLHRRMPFHRIALWDPSNGSFLRHSTLGSLGLTLSFGHDDYSSLCLHPSTPSNLTVIHTNGFHDVPVRYCNCPGSASPDLQIFGWRLFPSTVHSPQTAFSFDMLEQYRFHYLEGKTSAHTFMNALARLTDDTGHIKVEVCHTSVTLFRADWATG